MSVARFAVVLVPALLLDAGCTKSERTFDTEVQLARLVVVRRDDHGVPKALDVELEYTACPGDQLETLQGDAEFARCMAKYKVGDKLSASVHWAHTDQGHYDSEITRIGDCLRKRDGRDERSFEIVQVCQDVKVNGNTIGFHCDRKPTAELVAKCPWFRRT